MQKIAAIDTGSNAIRLVVADLDDDWQVNPVENIRFPIRLGQDVFTNNRLEEKTLQQVVEAFIQFRRIADDFGVSRIRAVGTSAVREAENKNILIDRISKASEINLNVISGDEEARLVHLAVSKTINLGERRSMLVDIGGGSVEVTISKGNKILSTNSYNMGTVRLLKKLDGNSGSQFSRSFVLLVREYADAARRRIEQQIGGENIEICIGTGGNVEEIGKLCQSLSNDESYQIVTMGELDKLIDQLGSLSVRERIRKFELRPDRADVILPASIVLQKIMEIAGINTIAIPNVGLKNGILLDMAEEMAQELHLPHRDQVWESALRMGQKYQFDQDHASLVSRLSCQLYDQAEKLHDMNGEERLLLEVGALLHDIGHFINTIDHDRHGYYLLKANHIIGLSDRQQEMVACLVRYHRKAHPFQDDSNYQALSFNDRHSVIKLCSILRLADALDASHTQRVTGVSLEQVESGWKLHSSGSDDLTLEKWAVMKRRVLFQDIFSVSLVID